METVIILILVALDQWTKGLAERLIGETGRVSVIPHFFELRLTYNKGAAWSFLSDHSWGIVFLSIVSIFVIVSLLYVLKHTTGKRARFVLMLVISGSVGNLIDRLRVGAVADFLSFTFGDYAFPTFNVADSLITVGTVLLVLFIIFDRSFLNAFLDNNLFGRRRKNIEGNKSERSNDQSEHDAQNVPDTSGSRDTTVD